MIGKRAEGGGWKKPWWGGMLGFLMQDGSNCVLLGLHHSMAGSLTNFSCCEQHKHFICLKRVQSTFSVAEFLGKRCLKLRSCQTSTCIGNFAALGCD